MAIVLLSISILKGTDKKVSSSKTKLNVHSGKEFSFYETSNFSDSSRLQKEHDSLDFYSILFEPAVHKSGINATKEFLNDNLTYPEKEYKQGIQGNITIGFIVEINGQLSNVMVMKSSNNINLDNEALRVVKLLSGKFNPAKFGGRSVRSSYMIPIYFEIEE